MSRDGRPPAAGQGAHTGRAASWFDLQNLREQIPVELPRSLWFFVTRPSDPSLVSSRAPGPRPRQPPRGAGPQRLARRACSRVHCTHITAGGPHSPLTPRGLGPACGVAGLARDGDREQWHLMPLSPDADRAAQAPAGSRIRPWLGDRARVPSGSAVSAVGPLPAPRRPVRSRLPLPHAR